MIRDWLEYIAICALVCGALFIGLALMPREVFAGECVRASYYGAESGNITANGERFTGNAMTAAHRTLPFGTKLRVTYQGRSVVVRVNDRWPYIRGRSLDLSTAAARKLGMIRAGVARARGPPATSPAISLHRRWAGLGRKRFPSIAGLLSTPPPALAIYQIPDSTPRGQPLSCV